MFGETAPVQSYGLAFERPVLTSVDSSALALCVAAIVAIFRFKVGMITTLLACSMAGIILHLAGLVS
jgi:chromate transporter